MENYEKKMPSFEGENMRMAEDFTLLRRGLYLSDIEHGKTKYSDDNLLIITDDDTSGYTEVEKELRNKVLEKYGKYWYARV